LNGKPKRRPDQKKKVKLRDQGVIPVPRTEFGGEEESDEELEDLGDEEGLEAGFLLGMDKNALSR
jgi:nucleolar complex protein 3